MLPGALADAAAPSRGFPPVVGEDPRVLILGSLPSVRSIEEQQYYAHPRNAFWPIMGLLLGAGRELEYAQRLAVLCERGIALWDTLATSVRKGSLDSNIDHSTAQPNDFSEFFARHPGVRLIAFNGHQSEKSFRRHVDKDPAVELPAPARVRLPSTSAANAAMTLQQKTEAWSVIIPYLARS